MESWVFGYGSLVCRPSLVEFLGREVGGPGWGTADLEGYRRLWNAAMDNTRDDPGLRFWADQDGVRHVGTVTYLGLRRDDAARVNGAVFRVTDEELEMFDRRELRYRRADVTAAVSSGAGSSSGRIFTYLPRRDAVARHRRSAEQGTDRISSWYLDRVTRAFSRIGPDYLEAYYASTDALPSPVADLVPHRIPNDP